MVSALTACRAACIPAGKGIKCAPFPSQRSELRTAIKSVRKAIASGDKAAAQKVLGESMSAIDSIADKKIIHKNKAARHKSRLSAAIKAL